MDQQKKLFGREELIAYISRHLPEIRKEVGLSQAQLSKILGISKNTIINTEKAEQMLGWPVVMSVVTLFQQTQAVKEITAEESALELISRCALLNDESAAKNKLLYSSLLGTASLSAVGLMAAGAGAGLPLLTALDFLVNRRKEDKDK